MTKLYIANCSKQAQVFNYRIPENPSARAQTIEIGSQVMIANDQLTDIQAKAIVDQHRKYGLFDIGEINTAKIPDQIPLVFSIGRPVDARTIQRIMSHNGGVLRIRGQELRKQAAIAVHNQLDEAMPGAVQATEMSVEEVNSGTMTHDDDGGPVAEGVRVTPGPETATGKGRGSRNKAR